MRLTCYLLLSALKETPAAKEVSTHDANPHVAGQRAGSGAGAMAAGEAARETRHAQVLRPAAAVAAGVPEQAQARETQVIETQAIETPAAGTRAVEAQAIDKRAVDDAPAGTQARAARGLCMRAYSPATQPRGSGRMHHAAALSPARRRRRIPQAG